MENNEQLFTIAIYMEDVVGVLNQVTIIFTRRSINIGDVTTSVTSIPGIRRITITALGEREQIEKAVAQIEKRIDVIKAFLYTDDQIFYQEIALYKVDTELLMEDKQLEQLIRQHNARILDLNKEYTVIEKSGQSWETEALLEDLRPYGVRQFVRSGRVCVTRSPKEKINEFLQKREARRLREGID